MLVVPIAIGKVLLVVLVVPITIGIVVLVVLVVRVVLVVPKAIRMVILVGAKSLVTGFKLISNSKMFTKKTHFYT